MGETNWGSGTKKSPLRVEAKGAFIELMLSNSP